MPRFGSDTVWRRWPRSYRNSRHLSVIQTRETLFFVARIWRPTGRRTNDTRAVALLELQTRAALGARNTNGELLSLLTAHQQRLLFRRRHFQFNDGALQGVGW